MAITVHYGKLTPAIIAKIIKDGKDGMHLDGAGLYLQVTNGGRGKSWIFRYKDRQTGKEHPMGLGSLYKVDLNTAREKRVEQWRIIDAGGDPIAVRNGKNLDAAHKIGLAKTVDAVIDEFLKKLISLKRSEDTKKAAVHHLKTVHRTIGDWPIEKVDTNTILEKVGLGPLWTEKPATAEKLLSLLHRVFSLAITKGYYHGLNPVRWKGHLENALAARRDVRRPEHHPALPHQEIGRFMQKLRAYEDRSFRNTGHTTSALALEFVILTGCRLSETLKATWNHIDLRKMIWTVPAENHKTGASSGKPLLRPITPPMLAVLEEMGRRHPSHTIDALIFPSPSPRHSIPTQFPRSALTQLLHDSLEYDDIDVHGFRSTLEGWCTANGYPIQLWQLQVGHAVGDASHQAYAHDAQIELRKRMMEKWGRYCAQPEPEPTDGSNIENLAERRRKAAS